MIYSIYTPEGDIVEFATPDEWFEYFSTTYPEKCDKIYHAMRDIRENPEKYKQG